MNRVVTESIDNARNVTLIGGRLQIVGGRLTQAEKDTFHEGTLYSYLQTPTSREIFMDAVRRRYVSDSVVGVFKDADVTYEMKYIPLLKCGDRLLALNNEDDDYITSAFFSAPMHWNIEWDRMLHTMTDGCLSTDDGRLLPINLSYKEVSYLVPRLGLCMPTPLQVVLLPFHTVHIVSGSREYHAAQVAVTGGEMADDFPLFNSDTFSAIMHVLFFVVLYGGIAYYVADHFYQARPFIEDYGKWWNDRLSVPDIRECLGGIIPILGWLVGMVLEFIVGLLLVILIIGIVPALALIVPAIAALILASVIVGGHWLWLRLRKNMLFRATIVRMRN